MDYLFTPWRMEYILSQKSGACFLCRSHGEKADTKNRVLFRASESFVLLNRYPYTNGHLMVAPVRHVSDLGELSAHEIGELFLIVQAASVIIRTRFHPHGINVGQLTIKGGIAQPGDRWRAEPDHGSGKCLGSPYQGYDGGFTGENDTTGGRIK